MSNVNSSNKFESIKIITWEKAQTQKAYTQSHKLSVTHNVFGALNHDQRTLLILHPLCYIWPLCILLHPGSTVHFQLASRLTTDRGRPNHEYLMHVQYRYGGTCAARSRRHGRRAVPVPTSDVEQLCVATRRGRRLGVSLFTMHTAL